MSKINAMRLINLNYNHNSIHVSDEVFHFNGESTLLSLRNGGGKSVLVQMMTAPFVHKRYRDAKDRPFASYFTTSKPSFILIEWMLDHGAGYVLTGMMVRQSQDSEMSNGEALEMINIISEYQSACLQDLHHLAVVEKGKKGMILKNFAACRQLFESYKKDPNLNFFCYDMNQGAQSRQYFEKLKEYQIDHKEWESIIKKVNLKESGLSDLFADCRDEKGLIEKWFLETIESKLNKEHNRIQEFQQIIEKYVGQYKDNQAKIKRRDTIRQFKEDAQQIQTKAAAYAQMDEQVQEQQNRIAQFLMKLDTLQRQTQERFQEIGKQTDEIHEAITAVEYEKLSYEIHNLKKEQDVFFQDQNLIAMEKEALERKAEKIEHSLHLMRCARLQEKQAEEKAELDWIQQKVSISRRAEKELEPERKQLGSQLKAYYQEAWKRNQGKQEENSAHLARISEQISEEKSTIYTLEQQIQETTLQRGALENEIQSYQKQEDWYLVKYQADFRRNLLGSYEPGFLEILQTEYEQGLQKVQHEKFQRCRALEQTEEKAKSLERRQNNLRETSIRMQGEQKEKTALVISYEQELQIRQGILKYLELPEKDLFNREKILTAAERKLKETEVLWKNLQKEDDELHKKLQKLTTGNWLELPAAWEQRLKNLGIPLVYGMEWLQKNGYSVQKNQEFVRQYPFLPYALLLSAADLEKLSHQPEDIYTSVPIPILLREQLKESSGKAHSGKKSTVMESSAASANAWIHLEKMHFYVLFQQELLDAGHLKEAENQILYQISRKEEAIAIRKQEYQDCLSRKETVQNQKVDQKAYESAKAACLQLEHDQKELEQQIQTVAQELAEAKAAKKQLEAAIETIRKDIERREQQKEDFSRLCQAYEEYEQNRKKLEKCRKEIVSQQECQKLANLQVEQLQEQQKTCSNQKNSLTAEENSLREQIQKYERYEACDLTVLQNLAVREVEKNSFDAKNAFEKKGAGKKISPASKASFEAVADWIAEMEVRYAAITSQMSFTIQELEEREQRAAKRYQRAEQELVDYYRKHHLKSGAWKGIRYDAQEEIHQETLLETCTQEWKQKEQQWNQVDKNIAILSNQIAERLARVQKEYRKERPAALSEIQSTDFEGRKNQLHYQEKELAKQAAAIQNQLNAYEENLAALSEYQEFQPTHLVEWEENFAEMNRESLRNFKGILVRDLNQWIRERQDAKEQLIYILNQMIRKSIFQEDYYKKPLELMLELAENAGQVLRQLETTIQSYDGLMEKLEVDISVVEKEKARITEILEDYVWDVHQNLGKIDQNSTIYIRQKAIKMLKIQIPVWEEQVNLYQVRIQDFIEELTQKGIEIFERNENAQEYFGIKMTTRDLYDTVVGICNIQIRLYKIEEQREYPITWAEVARNSGGEGFLSAFVILSSLLYYMRKDETDLFAEGNEGKVLVMDNPFAQTNASHLLIPLMDMAKKTNTQLICLTGLGGESIYNRFDNIYVMNLAASKLRSGNQYLRAEHLRGNEPEIMTVSQVEVIEQMKLEF